MDEKEEQTPAVIYSEAQLPPLDTKSLEINKDVVLHPTEPGRAEPEVSSRPENRAPEVGRRTQNVKKQPPSSGKVKQQQAREKRGSDKFDILKDFESCGDDPLCEASKKRKKR